MERPDATSGFAVVEAQTSAERAGGKNADPGSSWCTEVRTWTVDRGERTGKADTQQTQRAEARSPVAQLESALAKLERAKAQVIKEQEALETAQA